MSRRKVRGKFSESDVTTNAGSRLNGRNVELTSREGGNSIITIKTLVEDSGSSTSSVSSGMALVSTLEVIVSIASSGLALSKLLVAEGIATVWDKS